MKEQIEKLLEEWYYAKRSVIYETSTNWSRDIAKLAERKKEWKKILGMDHDELLCPNCGEDMPAPTYCNECQYDTRD